MMNKKLIYNEVLKLLIIFFVSLFTLACFASFPIFIYSIFSSQELSSKVDFETFFGKNINFLFQLFPFCFALGATLLIYGAVYSRERIKSIFTSRLKWDYKRFAVGFITWFSIMTFFFLVDYFFNNKGYLFNFSPTFIPLLFISIVFVFFQTCFEEVLFRGILQKRIAVISSNKLLPILSSSLFFGLVHYANPEVDLFGVISLIYFIGVGFFFALLTYYDSGLELALGFHYANNLFASVILTNKWQVFQTDALFVDLNKPELGVGIWIHLFVIFPVLFFTFAKFYKWNLKS